MAFHVLAGLHAMSGVSTWPEPGKLNTEQLHTSESPIAELSAFASATNARLLSCELDKRMNL